MSRERTRDAPFNPFLYRPPPPPLPSSILLPKHNRIEWTPEKWPRRNKCGGREGEQSEHLTAPFRVLCAKGSRLDKMILPPFLLSQPSLPFSQSQCRKFSLLNGVSNLFCFHGSIDRQAPHLSRGFVTHLPEIFTNPNRVNSKPGYNEKRSFSTALRRGRLKKQERRRREGTAPINVTPVLFRLGLS